ncbi:hypothetical protein [Halobacillus sp. BBL2006]|uniref:hypothetical protein n=1 Tax=Halobacillus sp. BBL2006 TaxID=1543706 RepID=UPI0005433A01|nr:hypothetical protein [Halobacillus sp. BBL2006]KHE66709.1 hypothetical protein LD39_21365 [Halobacillus sp. BBL2006]
MKKKKTTVKWFTGIATAVTAASFIGFVQNHPVQGESESTVIEQPASDSEDYFLFEDDHQFQGMEPSERRTRHS